jgi:hypothetical protein
MENHCSQRSVTEVFVGDANPIVAANAGVVCRFFDDSICTRNLRQINALSRRYGSFWRESVMYSAEWSA